ncbi:hypothetical protein [uncultured Roseivirga sp.]|uniref:hypothetical protein n=1 Tax=uncultured Roseivirga sp. TaxID=543088 RepID=UPI0030DAD7A4|tara:strand:+ start:1140 stop:1502 length:363 start_codon:yes stop_codon:yes gene_type:complete
MAKRTRIKLDFALMLLLIMTSCQMSYRGNYADNSEFVIVKCVSDSVMQLRGFKYRLCSEGTTLYKSRVPIDGVFKLNVRDSIYYQLEVTKKGFVTRNHYFYKHNILDTIKIEMQEVLELH